MYVCAFFNGFDTGKPPDHDSIGYDSIGYDSIGYDSIGYDSIGYHSIGRLTPLRSPILLAQVKYL
jgi:hypothetical protein